MQVELLQKDVILEDFQLVLLAIIESFRWASIRLT